MWGNRLKAIQTGCVLLVIVSLLQMLRSRALENVGKLQGNGVKPSGIRNMDQSSVF